jgi:hypothetical protein
MALVVQQTNKSIRQMRALLAAGAVPDTWAPNGSSALMLAAAANGVAALKVGWMWLVQCFWFGACVAAIQNRGLTTWADDSSGRSKLHAQRFCF